MGAEFIWALAADINKNYQGRRARKIEGGDRWLLISFGSQHELFFSWDTQFYGCCSIENEQWKGLASLARSTPPLLSAIKAHLLGAELKKTEQINHDRVLHFHFERTISAGVTQTRRIIFEPSGRHSNVILLGDDGKIIEAAKHVYPEINRFRSTYPGIPYTPPPLFEGPLPKDYLEKPMETLSTVRGLGAPLLKALKNGDDLAPFAECFWSTAKWTYQSLGHYITLFPSLLPDAQEINAKSPLDAARETSFAPLHSSGFSQRKKKMSDTLLTRLRRAERKFEEGIKMLDDDDIEHIQRIGTLLLANSWQIPQRATHATLTEWTEAGEREHSVELDPNKDVPTNAKRYFETYRKKKAARVRLRGEVASDHSNSVQVAGIAVAAGSALALLHEEMEAIKEQLTLIECQENASILMQLEREILGIEIVGKKSRRKTPPQLPPHKRIDLPALGALLYVGQSAKGNHYVTFKMGKGEDYWFHAQNIPGAHVLLRFTNTPDENTRQACYEIAASLAAWYSKGQNEERVLVDYTERKHVRAISGGGIAHVTYREFSSIHARTHLWQEKMREVSETAEENVSLTTPQ